MPIFGNQRSVSRRNLYIAYYARTPKPTSPGRYHAALIVLPDSIPGAAVRVSVIDKIRRLSPRWTLPMFSAPGFESKIASKYHVVNVPVPDETGKGRISWEFRVEEDDATVRDSPLRTRLVALMLVGVIELKPEDSLGEDKIVEDMVRKVVVPKYADEHPGWRCTTWVFEALKLLSDAKRIPQLPPIPIQDVWHIGYQFADKWRTAENIEMVTGTPCCDKEGNEIPSPLGIAM